MTQLIDDKPSEYAESLRRKAINFEKRGWHNSAEGLRKAADQIDADPVYEEVVKKSFEAIRSAIS